MTKAIIAAVVSLSVIPLLAQEEVFPVEIEDPAVTWIEKVAEAIKAKTVVTLTPDEVQALGQAYSALEQRQAADVALSETHVYVLSPAGAVVLSKTLPGSRD